MNFRISCLAQKSLVMMVATISVLGCQDVLVGGGKCGNGICDEDLGEQCLLCPQDCGAANTCMDYATCLSFDSCETCPAPPAELCNGQDDDCDARTGEEGMQLDCATGEQCRGGFCCVDDCSQPGLSECVDDAHFRTCGDYDEDGCMEWAHSNCDSGAVCGTDLCRCTGQSCEQLGYQCGKWSNGCGIPLDCGSCPLAGQECLAGQCQCAGPVCGDTCCAQGEVCRDLTCCSPQASAQCQDGDVYWFDSCGNQEEIKQACPSADACHTVTCADGACVVDEITECVSGDACCPVDCDSQTDSDCSVTWARRTGAGVAGTWVEYLVAGDDDSLAVAATIQMESIFGERESNETTLQTADNYETAVAKYASDGRLLWAKRFGGTEGSEPEGLAAMPGGQLTLLLNTDEVDNGVIGIGDISYYLTRLDADGQILWQRKALEIVSDDDCCGWPELFAGFDDGSVVQAGRYSDSIVLGKGEVDETTLSAPFGEQYQYLAAHESNGDLKWAIAGKGLPEVYFSTNALRPTADGSTLVAGSFSQSLVLGSGLFGTKMVTAVDGQSDAFVGRVDVSGTVLWLRSLHGDTSGGSIWTVAPMSDGYLLGLGVYGPVTLGEGQAGQHHFDDEGYHGYLARYLEDGTLLWAKQIRDGSGGVLKPRPDGSFLLAGSFEINLTLGPGEANETTLIPQGYGDLFVASFLADGSFDWVRHTSGAGNNVTTRQVPLLADQTAVVAGWFTERTQMVHDVAGKTQLISSGRVDSFLMRFDTTASQCDGLCGPSDCAPISCAEAFRSCGSFDDGCGTVLSCGTCGDELMCLPDNQCVIPHDLWLSMSQEDRPSARAEHAAVWTGSEMVIWGGDKPVGARYHAELDQWTDLPTEGAPTAVRRTAAVWADGELLVWGGADSSSPGYSKFGARWNAAEDRWQAMNSEGAPSARWMHTVVWNGEHMFVWGGMGEIAAPQDGGRYHAQTDTWLPMSTTGAPAGRVWPFSAWTGSALLVWGDRFSGDPSGGLYDPISDSWRLMSTVGAPNRSGFAAVWTGSELLVWGGNGFSDETPADGYRYDPKTDTWSAFGEDLGVCRLSAPGAVWTGTEMIIFGSNHFFGCADDSYPKPGLRFDPEHNTWSTMTTWNQPNGYEDASSIWTGIEAIFWGGGIDSPSADGGRYLP